MLSCVCCCRNYLLFMLPMTTFVADISHPFLSFHISIYIHIAHFVGYHCQHWCLIALLFGVKLHITVCMSSLVVLICFCQLCTISPLNCKLRCAQTFLCKYHFQNCSVFLYPILPKFVSWNWKLQRFLTLVFLLGGTLIPVHQLLYWFERKYHT